MINKKFNVGKSSWLILLCFGIILLSAHPSRAIPLTGVSIGWSNVDWALSINSSSGYFTNYTFFANEIGGGPAFCVENVGINPNASYELIAPTNTTAANIASQFFYNSTFPYGQAATQIAIWEIVFDSNNGLDAGIVQYNSGGALLSDIEAILKSYTATLKGPIWQASAPAAGTNTQSQDYLVSVPDAGIMWLLGPAFIMLGLLGRKKAKETL